MACKSDNLVRKNDRAFVDRSELNHFVGHIVLGVCDKVGSFLSEVLVKFLKGDITLVHRVENAGFDRDLVHHLCIVDLTLHKQDKSRDRSSEVHQHMHLERSIAMMKLCPGTQLKTQFNGAAVKRIYQSLRDQSQLFILIKHRGVFHQNHRKVLIDAPILLLIGLRKRGTGHHLDSQTAEVFAEVKCSLGISQTCSVDELGKAHHHELVTTIELDCMEVTLVAIDTLLELVFVKERHDLSEDCFSFVHGLQIAS